MIRVDKFCILKLEAAQYMPVSLNQLKNIEGDRRIK
jgi:hypothetical protein